MDLARELGYEDSPNYLRAEDNFPDTQELGYPLRKARDECGLAGAYVLRRDEAGSFPIPVLYHCRAETEEKAAQIHQRVWNQGLVPFILVESPKYLRLYSGFQYSPSASSEEENIGGALGTFREITSELDAFRAQEIDEGRIWERWGHRIELETRVDWSLLENLRQLDVHLRENNIERDVSHALIGKFVYFRYLRDREILSSRKLKKWGINEDSVFSRNATLESFCSLSQKTDEWLSGSIFPLDKGRLSKIPHSLFQKVAGVFVGDEIEGQLSLDFKTYNFSFIPIETLSVIYEQFLHSPEPGQSSTPGRESGAYYTPIPLVAFIQEELEKKRPLAESMTILDPSCGSGSFLVQSYRRLIEKQSAQEQRPLRPRELRDILTKQIFGVEREGDACRVAEMSLILTLLDYIKPPDLEGNNFKLPTLHNTNIFEADFFASNSPWTRAPVPEKFDWIVGNPPWVSLSSRHIRPKDRAVRAWMTQHSEDAPTGGNQVAEAFVWKTIPCLAQDGVAGLVLPAMTLFKKESTAFRKEFFTKAQTWCVANFSNLAYVLFAGSAWRPTRPALALFFRLNRTNEGPETQDPILTYSPLVVNQEANRPTQPGKKKDTWTITINAAEIQEVPTAKAVTGDMLPWKLAMWGSFRDDKLLERVRRKFPSFLEFSESHKLSAHQGFELREEAAASRDSLEPHPELEGRKRVDFSRLRGVGQIFVFPETAISTISKEHSYVRKGRVKNPMRVSTPPHLILDEGRRFAIYSDEFIAVPAGQIGIHASFKNKAILKALSLYLSSDFVKYQQFLTTSQWGISTSIATLHSLKSLPIPLDELSHQELQGWVKLRDTLATIQQPAMQPPLGEDSVKSPLFSEKVAELNDRVYSVLGLRESERTLVQDFISTNIHCIKGKVAKEVVQRPSEATMLSYSQRLKKELDTFIEGQSKNLHEIITFYGSRFAVMVIKMTQGRRNREPIIKAAEQRTDRELVRIQNDLRKRHSQWLYFNRALRIYADNTMYCFKPMQEIQWTERQAILDAGEVIAETLSAVESN